MINSIFYASYKQLSTTLLENFYDKLIILYPNLIQNFPINKVLISVHYRLVFIF